jgi:hypothetical protein
MVVTWSQKHAKNLVDYMVWIVAFWTCWYINSTSVELLEWDQCMFRLLGTFKLANNSYIVSYFSIGQPWKGIWNKDLNWIIFRFPSPEGLLTCYKIEFWPHWAHNHIFIKWAQSLAMYSPPLSSSQIEGSHKLQSYNQHVWLKYPIYIWQFCVCFQSRNKLCTSQSR